VDQPVPKLVPDTPPKSSIFSNFIGMGYVGILRIAALRDRILAESRPL
jgi:hypothetical protein